MALIDPSDLLHACGHAVFAAVLAGSLANAQALTLVSGATRSGTIAAIGASDSFEIAADTGDSFIVHAGDRSASAFAPRLRLLDPIGADIDVDVGNAPIIEYRATLSGGLHR